MAEVQPNSASANAVNSPDENMPGSKEPGKPAAKSKIPLYVVAALALAAAGAYFWMHTAASTSAVDSGAATESMFPLDTFVVNLEAAGQRSYLRVGITLGLSHPLNKKAEAPVALVRDAILSVLSSAQPERLLTSEGKEKLKADLLKALQERAPELGVVNVYFTEFLVQM